MRKSTTTAFLALGSITALVTLVGAYFLAAALAACFRLAELNRDGFQYTAFFFAIFSVANLCFLVALGVSALRLFRFDVAGVSLLSLTLKLELLYWLAVVLTLVLPGPLSRSAAGATGIGNMGLSPQLLIAYPLTGLLALGILKKCGVLRSEEPPVRPRVPEE